MLWASLATAAALYCTPGAEVDPVSVVEQVRAAHNAHDIAAMQRLFTQDAPMRTVLLAGVVDRSVEETMPMIQRDVFDAAPSELERYDGDDWTRAFPPATEAERPLTEGAT